MKCIHRLLPKLPKGVFWQFRQYLTGVFSKILTWILMNTIVRFLSLILILGFKRSMKKQLPCSDTLQNHNKPNKT